ncbi:MAG: AAA family ATPase [Candidatus Brocadiales bacterium]|nr:AAA family ATPase [Candidatus Brocadiales bacterium]
MKVINRIKLKNYKRFSSFDTRLNDKLNIFIGDNESGKSTILEAIDLVLSGSRSKIESLGISSLLNTEGIESFFENGKNYAELPKLYIELYLNECHNPDLNGDNNSEGITCDGLYLLCEPNEEFSANIRDVLDQEGKNFPFEFYTIVLKTFSDRSYSGYNKYFNHIFLDNTQINNKYATRNYIKTLFHSKSEIPDRIILENKYRKIKNDFKTDSLNEFNEDLSYQFALKSNSKSNLETDLTITEENVEIEYRGKGRQCFIKTDFVLERNETELETVLLEEPENHLSHAFMIQLIERIKGNDQKQLLIATHSNMITTRLGLRGCIMLNSAGIESVRLDQIEESTANFFMKAPDNNVLQFIMSKKVILVEGDAEYILMEAFYKKEVDDELAKSGIHVIAVGGKTFKRYLELAGQLGIKVAVVTDNDHSYKKNITDNYADYVNDNWKIFGDTNEEQYTFEVSLYNANQDICEELFSKGRRSLTVLEYMLQNKAECAFKLLEEKGDETVSPEYIKEAIAWIND